MNLNNLLKMRILLALLTVITLFIACDSNPVQKTTKTTTTTTVVTPQFSADSAYLFVKEQIDFGPRIPGSEPHTACANYLVAKLAQYCDTAFIQHFTATTFDTKQFASKNIIGSFHPEKTKRILLGAHWDTRPHADADPNPNNWDQPFDGANDGASGVGALIEIARQLAIKQPEVGVDIIFFDIEDYGLPNGSNEQGDWWGLGAQHWAKNTHRPKTDYQYGILLDMVGGFNPTFLREGFSDYYAPNIVAKVWKKAYELGYNQYFPNTPGNPITDDHYYVNSIARIPMINIIHQDHSTGTGFVATWHTLEDNLQNIDANSLKIAGTTVLGVIYDEK